MLRNKQTVVKQINKLEKGPVIIVCPLVALIENQVVEAEKLSITAAKLKDNVLSCDNQQIIGSPDSWQLNSKQRDMSLSEVYQGKYGWS